MNSYNMMTRYYKIKGIKAPYGHHEFQEKIAYGLFDTVHEWPSSSGRIPAKNCKRKSSSMKRKAAATAKSYPRSPKTSKSYLVTDTSSLKMRLDQLLEHLPLTVPGKNMKPVYQLHNFTERQFGKRKNIPDGAHASVMRCFTCGVNICLSFFFLFHKMEYLENAIIKIM